MQGFRSLTEWLLRVDGARAVGVLARGRQAPRLKSENELGAPTWKTATELLTAFATPSPPFPITGGSIRQALSAPAMLLCLSGLGDAGDAQEPCFDLVTGAKQ